MDMGSPITRAEHEEFVRRMEDEDRRQNKRIDLLEENVKEIGALTASVQKLADNMENMVKAQEQQVEHQKKQDERLEKIEGRDGEKWRTVTSYIITAVISILIGYLFKTIGM